MLLLPEISGLHGRFEEPNLQGRSSQRTEALPPRPQWCVSRITAGCPRTRENDPGTPKPRKKENAMTLFIRSAPRYSTRFRKRPCSTSAPSLLAPGDAGCGLKYGHGGSCLVRGLIIGSEAVKFAWDRVRTDCFGLPS
jgi:hypothetical protein